MTPDGRGLREAGEQHRDRDGRGMRDHLNAAGLRHRLRGFGGGRAQAGVRLFLERACQIDQRGTARRIELQSAAAGRRRSGEEGDACSLQALRRQGDSARSPLLRRRPACLRSSAAAEINCDDAARASMPSSSSRSSLGQQRIAAHQGHQGRTWGSADLGWVDFVSANLVLRFVRGMLRRPRRRPHRAAPFRPCGSRCRCRHRRPPGPAAPAAKKSHQVDESAKQNDVSGERGCVRLRSLKLG